MKLVNTTLYHFRDGRRKNNNWMVGSEFTVDSSYQNYICKDIELINSGLSLVEKKIEYYKMLRDNESPFNIGEKMLELYREEHYPEVIGRINCMYFCDEKSLEYWSHKFASYYEVYEVVLNGDAFKSASILFPFGGSNCTYEEFLKLCDDYWNPNLSSEQVNECAEYLFQGKVFVREKIDIEQIRSRS